MSRNLHRMEFPREIIIGHGSLNLVCEVCENLGLTESALVITGLKTQNIAGQRVVDYLHDLGLKVSCHLVTSNNVTMSDVQNSEKKIKRFKPQIIFGVGGGTKIDIAKLSSAKQGIPFVSVPTNASHDGIASPFASVRGLERPYSIKARPPVAVVADISIIINVPYRFVASGCADVVSKFTSTHDWKIAHERKNEYYAEYTASLALMSAQHISDNVDIICPGSEEGLRVLLEALISCGVAMCIGGTSKPCSGAEHLFSHALDLISPSDALHGEQCGLGTIMMAALHCMEWETIRKILQKVGAPTTAEELDLKSESIVKALVMASKIRPDRYTILNEINLTPKAALKLAQVTGVL